MEIQDFKNPQNILRPAPFWAINAKVDPKEVARQMEDMRSVGLSGAFFHARIGLETQYLSDEWFNAMDAALDVAKKTDGYLWLYDEDLWPSGNAGGQVAGMNDEYRSALLEGMIVAPGESLGDLSQDQAIRRCYIIKSREGLNLKDYESVPLDKISDYANYERLFMVRTYMAKSGWWSGESYSNLLHPDAMRVFVSLTHEVYKKKYGAEFGKRIPGIFTDEPQIASSKNGFAWYEGLPELYYKWTGRDWWADVPYLFFDGESAGRARLLVHRAIQRQFLEAYTKPLYEWCEENNLQHTGHFNSEETLEGQLGSHYGGVMAHYRYQQAPGIDHLCRQTDNYIQGGGMQLTVKQVASAARQLGRKRVLTEIFGVTRHTNTFENFKWLGDYNLVLGANFFVPHLAWYTAKGRRKRDYPPNWNYQQTYWKDLNPLNDYFTRLAVALTSGKPVANVLMLHAIESASTVRRFGVEVRGEINGNARKSPVDVPVADMSAVRNLDENMRRTFDSILFAGYDCDLGDEGYIEDYGSVEGDSFIIGEMAYKVVVVPPSITWRPNTFALLEQFVANGGQVIICGDTPSLLDCEDARQKWLKLTSSPNVQSIPCSILTIQNTMDAVAPKPFVLKGSDGLAVAHTHIHHRKDCDQDILFVVNSDPANPRKYVLTFPNCAGKSLVKWDAVEGTCETLSPCVIGDDIRYEFDLPASGSILLTLGGEIPCEPAKTAAISAGCDIQPLGKEFDYVRSDDNVLVIDRMSVSFDGGKTFCAEDMEFRIRRMIAKKFGTEKALEWQSWVAIKKGIFDGKGGEIVLRYKFLSSIEKPKASLVIEEIEKGNVTVNGARLDISNSGWHWDHSFGKVDITDHVRIGENTVDFKVNYDFLTEIEAAYIVGDFGVNLIDPFRGEIVAEPKKLTIGSFGSQAFPFYSGRMTYKADFEASDGKSTILRLTRPSGILYKVRVNGEHAGNILWQPFELDITSFVRSGKNAIEIEVVSSLQNSWGPLHNKLADDLQWSGPNAFEDENDIREELNSFSYGLLGGAEIVIA